MHQPAVKVFAMGFWELPEHALRVVSDTLMLGCMAPGFSDLKNILDCTIRMWYWFTSLQFLPLMLTPVLLT